MSTLILARVYSGLGEISLRTLPFLSLMFECSYMIGITKLTTQSFNLSRFTTNKSMVSRQVNSFSPGRVFAGTPVILSLRRFLSHDNNLDFCLFHLMLLRILTHILLLLLLLVITLLHPGEYLPLR